MKADRLREKFSYDEEYGRFRHLLTGKGITQGALVKGQKMTNGYLSIWVDGKQYLYHRAVFLWHHGYLPKYVDHRDRDKGNPRIENLRDTSPSRNAINTDAKCVERNGNGWCSRVQVDGVRHYLGQFRTEEEAEAAAAEFKKPYLE